jgi:hypothetical protein
MVIHNVWQAEWREEVAFTAQSDRWDPAYHGDVLLRGAVNERWSLVVVRLFDAVPRSTIVPDKERTSHGKTIDTVTQRGLGVFVIKAVEHAGDHHKVEGTKIERSAEGSVLKTDVGDPSYTSSRSSAFKKAVSDIDPD